MVTYTLKDLIRFWDEISRSDFDGIRVVLSIVNSEDITVDEKLKLILAALRLFGLEEYQCSTEPDIGFLDEPKIFQNTINPIQLFDIHFDNGKIDFWQNLN